MEILSVLHISTFFLLGEVKRKEKFALVRYSMYIRTFSLSSLKNFLLMLRKLRDLLCSEFFHLQLGCKDFQIFQLLNNPQTVGHKNE